MIQRRKVATADEKEVSVMDTKNIAILYVDDEKENLRVLELLMRRKFKIFVAQDAEAALEVLSQNKIHVILTDEKMNGMNGTELLKVVDEKYPHIIKMLPTGDDNQVSVRNALKSQDIFACVIKPFDRKSLGDLFINGYQKLIEEGYAPVLER